MSLCKGKHLKSALCGIQNDGTCWLTLYTTTVLVILSVDVSVVVLYVSIKLNCFGIGEIITVQVSRLPSVFW